MVMLRRRSPSPDSGFQRRPQSQSPRDLLLSEEGETQPGAASSPVSFHVALAAFIRFTLLVYGVFHDQVFTVKYTDVDYRVFTDGARFVRQGRSPFLREGYRYTPLIAFLLVPNLYVSLFGKVLFLLFDLLTGCLIHDILSRIKTIVPPDAALLSTLTWLYNPLPLVVSTRGSSDSMQTFLVLTVFACLSRGRPVAAGLLFGLAVHVKQYPVIFAPAIFLLLSNELPDGSLLSYHLWTPLNRRRLAFFMSALFAFAVTTGSCFLLFQQRYVQEAWLYHFTRRDVQHNFSVYFFVYHLLPAHLHSLLASLAFIPQLLVVVVVSLRHMTCASRCPEQRFGRFLFAAFLLAFLFVSLNKVITSQYFLWYLCLLPFALPLLPRAWRIEKSAEVQEGTHVCLSRQFWAVTACWLAGQALWLLPAYLFEFLKWQQALPFVWIASIAFLAINLAIAAKLSPCFPQLNKARHQ